MASDLHLPELVCPRAIDLDAKPGPDMPDYARLPCPEHKIVVQVEDKKEKGQAKEIPLEPHPPLNLRTEQSRLCAHRRAAVGRQRFCRRVPVLLFIPMVKIWAVVMLQLTRNQPDISIDRRLLVYQHI